MFSLEFGGRTRPLIHVRKAMTPVNFHCSAVAQPLYFCFFIYKKVYYLRIVKVSDLCECVFEMYKILLKSTFLMLFLLYFIVD